MNLEKNSEKLFSEMSVQEQREFLQESNPDKLPGVFDLKEVGKDEFKISCVENIVCCYPNQLEDGQIELPEDFGEGSIVIVNLGSLRKGYIEVIGGNDENLGEIGKPTLLSPGVIEYWEGENGKKYTQTVLRDAGKGAGIKGLADANERTTTAGRNFSGNLWEDLEMENAEESPFLMKNKNGEYVLVTHNLQYKEYLQHSIQDFLSKKYLQTHDEGYEIVKEMFEKKFSGVKYEELGAILQNILDNERFEQYTWKNGEIQGIETKTIKMGEEQGDFYVFNDLENNTIEYRAIREITGFPEGLQPVGRIPLRLFLESQNQSPSFKKIENVGNGETKLVPTIRDFSDRVNRTLNP